MLIILESSDFIAEIKILTAGLRLPAAAAGFDYPVRCWRSWSDQTGGSFNTNPVYVVLCPGWWEVMVLLRALLWSTATGLVLWRKHTPTCCIVQERLSNNLYILSEIWIQNKLKYICHLELFLWYDFRYLKLILCTEKSSVNLFSAWTSSFVIFTMNLLWFWCELLFYYFSKPKQYNIQNSQYPQNKWFCNGLSKYLGVSRNIRRCSSRGKSVFFGTLSDFRTRSHLALSTQLRTKYSTLLTVIKTTVFYI